MQKIGKYGAESVGSSSRAPAGNCSAGVRLRRSHETECSSYAKTTVAFGPHVGTGNDDRIHAMALAGTDVRTIARAICRPPADVVLRLVELELGPLGCVHPPGSADSAEKAAFGNVRPRPSGIHRGNRQAPILRLAAAALAPSLQRLGDRLYLDGAATDLPAVVRRARACGAAIRYPGIDPMERSYAAGPSSAGAKRRRSAVSGVRP